MESFAAHESIPSQIIQSQISLTMSVHSKYGPGQQSFEDAKKALSEVPLFMRELPESGEMDEEASATLEALKSLLYEGDAEGLSELSTKWQTIEIYS